MLKKKMAVFLYNLFEFLRPVAASEQMLLRNDGKMLGAPWIGRCPVSMTWKEL